MLKLLKDGLRVCCMVVLCCSTSLQQRHSSVVYADFVFNSPSMPLLSIAIHTPSSSGVHNQNFNNFNKNNRRPRMPQFLKEDEKRQLRRMWHRDPRQRPSFEEIVDRFDYRENVGSAQRLFRPDWPEEIIRNSTGSFRLYLLLFLLYLLTCECTLSKSLGMCKWC